MRVANHSMIRAIIRLKISWEALNKVKIIILFLFFQFIVIINIILDTTATVYIFFFCDTVG